jgi:hypothetical protein
MGNTDSAKARRRGQRGEAAGIVAGAHTREKLAFRCETDLKHGKAASSCGLADLLIPSWSVSRCHKTKMAPSTRAASDFLSVNFDGDYAEFLVGKRRLT